MLIELLFLGIGTGVLSGFFGVGGGTILVPFLLILGYDIKSAVGIAVVQMVFSSVYGSYLNLKKGTLDVKMVLTIGLGGFLGALNSGFIVANVSDQVLEVTFLGFVLFALARLFMKTKESKTPKKANFVLLFVIGYVVGTFSISIGVGGSILIVPILVGFLNVPLKNAISAGLFFVVFSSLSGLISLGIQGQIDYMTGATIGSASLLGVSLGIYLKHQSEDKLQRQLLLLFYTAITLYLAYRMVGNYGQ